MRRLLAISVLALAVFAVAASSALGASKKPSVTSFSPAQVPVGGTLTIKGKNFRSGATKNRVFFTRASDGKAVRARPKSASKTRITVVVPSTITKFLDDDGKGGKKATRFQLSIFTTVLGAKTKRTRSPIILPAGSAPVPGGGGTPPPPGATAADCDGDGTPNETDNDDDNDLIGDATEAKIGTDPCKADTDGDGIEDGFEYTSALDLNSAALPYPGARPFPNPLDASDAGKDFDRDGLSDMEEYQAWIKFGNHQLPLNYSAGRAVSDGSSTPDGNRDADGDGLANVTELAKATGDAFNPGRLIDKVPYLIQLDWLVADTDGDTINDGADDNDHDGLSNIEEITDGDDGRTTDPENPDSGTNDCDNDGTPNGSDNDDDNDGLPDTLEKSLGLSQCNKDTDGDGVEDGFEYYSARDLNGNANPYPGKRPFPNALDGSDAGRDYDGDGLTNKEEFSAWVLYGGRVLPTASGQSFPYSDGNQTSTAPANPGAMDLDGNSKTTDDEKDADNDGLPNWVELAKGETGTGPNCAFANSTGPGSAVYVNIYTDCGGGRMPNGFTFADLQTQTTAGTPPPAFDAYNQLNWLDPDTDGDQIKDSIDDEDFDGSSNIEEIKAGNDTYYTNPEDPCDPDPDSPTCPRHPSHNP